MRGLLRSAQITDKGNSMKKSFSLENLDCANCAAKMEHAVSKIDGVNHVSISFIAQRMTLDADDARFDDILAETVRKCRKIEPDCKIRV